jgi:hypothetical protein
LVVEPAGTGSGVGGLAEEHRRGAAGEALGRSVGGRPRRDAAGDVVADPADQGPDDAEAGAVLGIGAEAGGVAGEAGLDPGERGVGEEAAGYFCAGAVGLLAYDAGAAAVEHDELALALEADILSASMATVFTEQVGALLVEVAKSMAKTGVLNSNQLVIRSV